MNPVEQFYYEENDYKYMKNVTWNLKNRCKLYAGTIVGALIIGHIISAITGIAMVNTWLVLVVMSFISLVIVAMFLDIAKTVKTNHPVLTFILRFAVFSLITNVIIVYFVILFIEV